MANSNKKRYQSQGNPWPRLHLSGQIFLKHADDDEIAVAQSGDVMCFLNIENNPQYESRGSYFETGIAGYLRAEVYDGKRFKPLDMNALLPDREYYFHKSERPIDRYELVRELLVAKQGTVLMRTYREHYTVDESGELGNSEEDTSET